MLVVINWLVDGEVCADPLVEQVIDDLNRIQEGLVSKDVLYAVWRASHAIHDADASS